MVCSLSANAAVTVAVLHVNGGYFFVPDKLGRPKRYNPGTLGSAAKKPCFNFGKFR